ncbi:enoyl-CoA hydratase/isomerase family protein [bacterium]|nr:enoyl-CoA hydratase/isomerase family protein [bacterium]
MATAERETKNSAQPMRLEKRGDVALVWFDDPADKVNKLSPALFDVYGKIMDELEKDGSVKAVVWISAKEGNFIAGADVNVFRTITSAEQGAEFVAKGKEAFDRITNSKKVQIAAIGGACLGGGLEFALACHYRIATSSPKTVFGTPEVKLGLLPAGDGTQKLPRVVGLAAALDMMLTGKNIYARKARSMGLVNEVVIPFGLDRTAEIAARRLIKNGYPDPKSPTLPDRLMKELGPLRHIVLNKARESVLAKTKGNYPAPLAIIECVGDGLDKGVTAGRATESRKFGELLVTPESRRLVGLFFAMQDNKKHPLARGAKPTEHVGMLGAGLMGAGIALVSSQNADTPVTLKDIDAKGLAGGEKYVFDRVDKRFRKKAITRLERDRILARVHGSLMYEDFARADLVIEAVFEDLDLKKKVIKEVEAVTGPECVFASNTSALPIGEIAKASKRPETVIGMHYFSPVEKMPLLEVIRAEKSADWAIAKAVAFGIRQGKTVIVVKDGPGFYTTRILGPYMNETCVLLEEGARIRDIDRALTAWGYPVGPVVLFDEVGIDVAAHISEFLGGKLAAERPSTRTSHAIHEIAKAGYYGRKNRKGFYTYAARKKGPFASLPFIGGSGGKEPNEEIYRFFGGAKIRKDIPADQIAERIALAMVNEAARCLDEGIIASPTDGDLGAILGLGFPPFTGGPFRYIDAEGADKIADRLKRLEEKHGGTFAPADGILANAKKSGTYYKD